MHAVSMRSFLSPEHVKNDDQTVGLIGDKETHDSRAIRRDIERQE